METAILLAAYGSAHPQSRHGLRKFENECRTRFPGFSIRWAYTSLSLRTRLSDQRQKSDSPLKAIERLAHEKFSAVAIQPLQAIPGKEYETVRETADSASRRLGLKIAVGAPLLRGEADCQEAASALIKHLPEARKADENVIFMGHGAKHSAFAIYGQLAKTLENMDPNIHLGVMNGPPFLDDIIKRLKSGKVWLLPLLSLVGRHVLEDMGGEKPFSWRSQLSMAGHDCIPVFKGLTEYGRINSIWLNRLEETLNSIA